MTKIPEKSDVIYSDENIKRTFSHEKDVPKKVTKIPEKSYENIVTKTLNF